MAPKLESEKVKDDHKGPDPESKTSWASISAEITHGAKVAWTNTKSFGSGFDKGVLMPLEEIATGGANFVHFVEGLWTEMRDPGKSAAEEERSGLETAGLAPYSVDAEKIYAAGRAVSAQREVDALDVDALGFPPRKVSKNAPAKAK